MSSATSKSSDWLAGLAEGCGRFVPPSVSRVEERERRRRYVGTMLAAPFLVALAAVLVVFGHVDLAAALALLCGVAGLSWFAAILVVCAFPQPVLESVALVTYAAVAALILAVAGGAAAPVGAILLALPLEAWWVRRTRQGILAGSAAAAAAFGAQFSGLPAAFEGSGGIAAWQWLVPLAYLATLWLRRASFLAASGRAVGESRAAKIDSLIDAVVVRLGQNGDIHDVSDQASRLLHLQPELLLGTGLFERIHLADRVGYLSALADMRAGAANRHADVRLRLPRASGSDADSHLPFSVEFAAGEGGLIAFLRDGSEKAALKERLEKAIRAADSSEIAKGRFLAAVSHELRTPLNAILGFSDMLLHEMLGCFADPRQKEYVGLIRESGNHLLSVVNSILDVSKIEAGTYAIQTEPFVFRDTVDMCVAMMAPQAATKSIAIRTRIAAGVGEICADSRAVRQMLINLLSNAVKFTPEGGKVEIGARRTAGRLSFWVSDNGIGISEADLSRLGRPFMQVQNDYTRRFEGTGLGLSLVKGLVTLHHGSMTIESAPGEGTTVSIVLPVDAAEESGPAARKAAANPVKVQYEEGDAPQRKAAIAG